MLDPDPLDYMIMYGSANLSVPYARNQHFTIRNLQIQTIAYYKMKKKNCCKILMTNFSWKESWQKHFSLAEIFVQNPFF
jgi:hypothetical protein